MGKRQDGAKKTRESIILAAKELHEKHGIGAVSVDDIVQYAGVSKGSFYTYFKRREDVAQEIALREFDTIKRRVHRLRGHAGVKIGKFLVESACLIEKNGLELCKEWMKSAVSPIRQDTPGQRKYRYDRDYILELLANRQDAGTAQQRERDADCIMSQYYGAVALWALTDGAFPMVQTMKDFVQLHLSKT